MFSQNGAAPAGIPVPGSRRALDLPRYL